MGCSLSTNKALMAEASRFLGSFVLSVKSLRSMAFSSSSLGISDCSQVEGSFGNSRVVEEGFKVVTP